ncbi:unnamed protein product, partial [Hydatigera taeniaeformis]|uniref:ABC1 domain-containing protein n=1 Tax=Hydatigena taeniaeformis TaxID=6205 RepID=A0A0R3WT83_HYDTA
MVYSYLASDCVKVLRGVCSVLSTAVSIQADEVRIFLELVGARDCIRGVGQLRPVTACDIKRRSYPRKGSSCTNSLDSLIKIRSFSTSIKASSESPPAKKTLSSSRERHVPSTRIGRAVGFGRLGAATEYAKRSIGASDKNEESNIFLNDANLERIVDTLCRMRGAALKLGQMLSIQDSSLVSPKVQKIFERVRQSADFMPTSQMYQVVDAELGTNWREKLASFDAKPFAAASIGQVHLALLPDGRRLAMKVQYPGVGKSIETDVANITMILKRFNFLPRGLFAESAIRTAKRELKWECDYMREASYAEKFARLLINDPVFLVPKVFHDFSTQKVLTMEYFEGLVLDDCISLSQDVRNW